MAICKNCFGFGFIVVGDEECEEAVLCPICYGSGETDRLPRQGLYTIWSDRASSECGDEHIVAASKGAAVLEFLKVHPEVGDPFGIRVL